MARIRTLPDDVARRIAAGEVVERPASVVKELLENAADAGARTVHVTTAGAGEVLIEVRDDGCGMSREDVALAPRNFSTSKIADSSDLERVATYGFRGEALASISAVSRFELVSSDAGDGRGWRVRVEGRTQRPVEPAAHERGTTVRVRDLFFNTPARKRFLKSPLTERRRILEAILAFALIQPEVELHYVDDGRHVLDLLPAPSWRDRVAAVLGGDAMAKMVPVAHASGAFRLEGFVSLPELTRANRSQQFYFVNGRPVRERTLVSAVQEGLRNVIPPRRFPVAVLALHAPPEMVDVNVHPTKLEVRVRETRRVFALVRQGVKLALSPSAESAMGVSLAGIARGVPSPVPGEAGEATVREAQDEHGVAPDNVIPLREGARRATEDFLRRHPAPREDARARWPRGARAGAPPPARDSQARAVEGLREGMGDEALFWQFASSYVFIQVRGGLVVIDQHAAHERIIYDRTRRQIEGSAPPSQQILFRIHLELSLAELEVFRAHADVFRRLGFDLEPFGGTSILVRGYPQGLRNWDDGKLLLGVFDDILNDRAPGDTVTERLVASYACRSAIRAGQRLSVDEMRALADELFAIENPYSCPHGRPTIHRIALDEIGRWFERR